MPTRFRQSSPAAQGMPAPSYRTSLRVDQRGDGVRLQISMLWQQRYTNL